MTIFCLRDFVCTLVRYSTKFHRRRAAAVRDTPKRAGYVLRSTYVQYVPTLLSSEQEASKRAVLIFFLAFWHAACCMLHAGLSFIVLSLLRRGLKRRQSICSRKPQVIWTVCLLVKDISLFVVYYRFLD